ncbi:hypothetical protein CYLTODRAFT_489486 [Cylindrobasidium torrendii FP15055 ss-10]|uniref:BTB domain-containing protein n=1 Tax=Cylindrobasidium torrendii FP15055 ss-10 TaxID=1314674 RepID=A0A0D7BF00_9AGAR|nr:hypothetical protein CYLTODRAFT_489486 [Cylindrobasidium torrendii FP15055 ss-10]
MAHRPPSAASSNGAGLRLASAPFDTPDGADIALRTSDDTIFVFRKCFLIAASPFFSNLLADGVPDKVFRRLPLCPVLEDSETMHFVLRLCSPNHITMGDLVVALSSHPVLSTLDKYIMDAAHQRVVNMFQEGAATLIKEAPLRAFALARELGQDTIARQAARQLLCVPMDKWKISDQAILNIRDYHGLVQYFLRCGQAAFDAANIAHTPLGGCATCMQSFSSSPNSSGLKLGSSAVHIRKGDSLVHLEGVAKLQSVLDARHIFRLCPGTRQLPEVVFENLCDVSKLVCGSQWESRAVRMSLKRVFAVMYKEIDEAIDRVPLGLSSV